MNGHAAAAGDEKRCTAFVLAGGGSLGAVQVGMLKALSRQGIVADFVVGASAGAINGAYYAADPDEAGVARLERIWQGLRRADIFPLSFIGSLSWLLGRRDYLATPAPLQSLIESELPYRQLEQARLPCHIVATDVLDGTEVVFSKRKVVPALLASAAIPVIFPIVSIGERHLMDGGPQRAMKSAAGRVRYSSSRTSPPARNCQVRVTWRMSMFSSVFGSGGNGTDSCTMRIAVESSRGMPLDWMMRLPSTEPSRRTATLITSCPDRRLRRASSG